MIPQKGRCPNFNHGRTNAPVRFCPLCGDVVNHDIPTKRCTKEEHAIKRRERNRYCVDCDEQLIQGR